jgi:outer membrane protein
MRLYSVLAGLMLAISTATHADTFLGLYVGADAWGLEASGEIAENDNALTEFNFDDQTQPNLYIAFEHIVPVIPNVKIAATQLDTSGLTSLSTSFQFNGQLFITASDVNTEVSVSNIDYTLYYEFLDNDLISFDLGVTVKQLDGDIVVQDASDAGLTATRDISGFVPMLYSKVGVGLPLTGLGLVAEGNYLSIGDSSLIDYQAVVTYDVIDTLAVNMDIRLGYRSFTLELDDFDDLYSDMEFSGAFAGVEVHF